MTVFACFAAQNCTVSEEVINPDRRRDVAAHAEDVYGQELPHLRRAWDDERARYEQLRERESSEQLT